MGFILLLVLNYVYTSKTRVAHVRSEAYRGWRRAETPARNGTEVVVGEFAIPIGHSAALSRILENSIAKPPAGRLNRATYIDRSRNEAANPLAFKTRFIVI